jgi:ATP-binding cassette subfamily F protein 3
MSGGEKARLVLAMIVWQRPNLLLLDEPTNHLDLATREALSMALNEFEGTVMLVSHDRALLRAVCDEFWMVGRGQVEPFDGDLDDYQKYLLDESKRLRELAKNTARDASPATNTNTSGITANDGAGATPALHAHTTATVTGSADAVVSIKTSTPAIPKLDTPNLNTPSISSAEQRKIDAQKRQLLAAQTRPLKRELEQNEQRMTSIEAEKMKLETLLTTPVSPAEMADAGRRLKALAEEVSALEERWLELTSKLEETTAA